MGRGWGGTTTGARRRPGQRSCAVAASIIVTIGVLSVSASAATSTATWKARLDKQVPTALKQAELPGVVVGVWKDGKRVYRKAFGVSDTKTGAPLKAASHVRIGSLTKAYTIMGILQLAADGELSLDDPIGRYIAGVPNGDIITIRQLAEMRSGLGDYSAVVVPNIYKDPQKKFTTQELLDIGFSLPVRAQPGTEFDYNNLNTTLLGAVLEKVSGVPRAQYVQDHIAKPLGLKDTLVPASNAIPEPHSRGYGNWNPEEQVEDETDWNPSWGNAAGDMISNLDDIGTFTRALGQGKLITAEMKKERDKGLPAATEGVGALYGLAYEIHPGGWQGHNGRIAGWTTYPYYLSEKDITIVVSINTSANVLQGWELFQSIVKTVTPDHPFSDPPTA
jgi:D-alanyl-D-alanine carboxypeptidase